MSFPLNASIEDSSEETEERGREEGDEKDIVLFSGKGTIPPETQKKEESLKESVLFHSSIPCNVHLSTNKKREEKGSIGQKEESIVASPLKATIGSSSEEIEDSDFKGEDKKDIVAFSRQATIDSRTRKKEAPSKESVLSTSGQGE